MIFCLWFFVEIEIYVGLELCIDLRVFGEKFKCYVNLVFEDDDGLVFI